MFVRKDVRKRSVQEKKQNLAVSWFSYNRGLELSFKMYFQYGVQIDLLSHTKRKFIKTRKRFS